MQHETSNHLSPSTTPPFHKDVQTHTTKLEFEMQENSAIHNSYLRELRQLECIRQGNLEGIRAAVREPMEGSVGTLARDPLTSRKYVAVCAMAIYARAAIDGGILSDEAFAAGDSWALRIDAAQNIEEVDTIGADMAVFFAQMVHDHKQSSSQSASPNKQIEKCKKYIFQHLHEKLTLQAIAAALYLNPDYLSHLFSSSEGITIARYIRKKRMEQAKNLLMYSPYDCKSIAQFLGYSGQSHFGKIFKEETGLSPDAYKKKYGKDTFI